PATKRHATINPSSLPGLGDRQRDLHQTRGASIGITRHFRDAARGGAGLVFVSVAGSLVLGVLWHFVLGGPSSLRVAVRSGVPVVARVFEVSVTLHVATAAAALLLAALAFRRRTSILSIGRIPGVGRG
ncbi:hypothetical protein, partial [Amycolatopsis sp. NPDC051372]|uniref:hypothetical protein n=1 Tax=Amycolatopsis sp. NPDC051372 TaxID=3155669 RepID=UPI00343950D0